MSYAQPIVSVVDLTVDYQTDRHTSSALHAFTMHASRAHLVALSGPSGSGKTTLLSVLSGMVEATSGQVVVDGIDVRTLSGAPLETYRRQTVGIVFQNFNLIPSLSARENVAAPLLVAKVGRRAAMKRAERLLREVGLGGHGDRKPTQLSGGEQQRVALARGLIGDPKVLLADEPTANLDRASAQSALELLRQLRDRGRTIIISTHDDRLLDAMDQVVTVAANNTARSTSDSTSGMDTVSIPTIDLVGHHALPRQLSTTNSRNQ